MRIAIFGAGAIGSLVGAMLSEKHEVLLVGREAHMRAVKDSGLVIEGETEMTAHPMTCTSVSAAHARDFNPDIVFVTVKAYDTAEAARSIMSVWPDISDIISMQNGIGNTAILRQYLPASGIYAVLTTHGATFVSPGRVRHAGKGRTFAGLCYGRGDASRIAALLTDAGMETETVLNISEHIWMKAAVNASINPITAILRQKNGVIAESKELVEIVRTVSAETAAVAKAEGMNLDGAAIFTMAMETVRRTSRNHSSMLQDILAGRQTEIDFINGAFVQEGKKRGIDIPATETLYALLKALENRV